MVVHTAKKGGGRVSADCPLDKMRPARVIIDERRAIMDEPVDGNEGPLLRLGLEIVPADDREVIAGLRPVESLALLLKLPELHGELTLLDFVIGEALQVGGETELRHGPNEPFGWVVLEPLNGVAEIHRKLVVEVVVPLADGAERSEEVIAGSVLVVEWLVAEPMGKRIDAKR